MNPGGRWHVQALASPVLLALIALVLVTVCHLPLRHGEFVLDDHTVVENNPIVERGDAAEIFTSYWSEGGGGSDRGLYRPLPVLTFALERRLTRLPDPVMGRVINVVLHLLTSGVLLALCRRLGCSALTTAATVLLFALHPVHVEAIAGVVGRAELLAAFWGLLALWCSSYSGAWGASAAPSAGRARIAAWAAGGALFLALASKEIALAVLPLMAALELMFRPQPSPDSSDARRAWWVDRGGALAPSALALTVYLILRVNALESLRTLQQVLPAENPLVALQGTERLATALGLVGRYATLLLYPIRLSADYSGGVIPPEPGFIAVRPWFGLLLLSGGALLALRPLASGRRVPGASVGAARVGFAVLLLGLPYLIVGNLFFPVGAVLAERFLYLPSTGFCLLVGLLLHALAGADARHVAALATRWLVAALIILVVAYGTRSWSRCLDWRDDATLMRAAAFAQPRSARAHYIVGVVAVQRDEREVALAYLRRASELQTDFAAPRLELGLLLAREGAFDEARAELHEALRLVPGLARAHYGLALILRRQQRPDEAEIALRKATLRDPTHAGAWAELGNLRLELRRWDGAVAAYRRGVALGRADLQERIRLAEKLRESSATP